MPEPPIPELPIRDTFDNEPVQGIGGYMEFQLVAFDLPLDQRDPQRLHISQWEIWHEYRNIELPEGGRFGSLSVYRVADTFRFMAALDMDLKPQRDYESVQGPNIHVPHLDGRLEGHPQNNFRIRMLFCCGDPTFWDNPEMQSIARPKEVWPGISYRCNSVILERVYILNSARGDDVVTCRVEGRGSSPLRRYVGIPWCGAGALGISQIRQKHRTVWEGD